MIFSPPSPKYNKVFFSQVTHVNPKKKNWGNINIRGPNPRIGKTVEDL